MGCGGSNVATTYRRGSLNFSVTWPAPSRVIPTASNAIVITVKDGSSNIVATGLIAKPATAWSSPLLSPGNYSVTANAVPNADGSGVVQATGGASAQVVEGQATDTSLTMGSTVNSVSLTIPKSSIAVGETIQLVAECKDTSGNLVLVAPSSLKWLSNNTSAATISASGVVTGVGFGTPIITATFEEVEGTLGQNPVVSSGLTVPIYPLGFSNILVGFAGGAYQWDIPGNDDPAWGYLQNENLPDASTYCKSSAYGSGIKIEARLPVGQNQSVAFNTKIILNQPMQCQYSWRGGNAHWGNLNGRFQTNSFWINGVSYNTFQFAARGADGNLTLPTGTNFIRLYNGSTGPDNAPATFTVLITP